MKALVILVLVGLFAVSGKAQQVTPPPKGEVITLSPEQSEDCKQNGGCLVVPKHKLQMYIMQLKAMIEAEQKELCLKGLI